MKTTEEIALNFQNKPLNTKWYSEKEYNALLEIIDSLENKILRLRGYKK